MLEVSSTAARSRKRPSHGSLRRSGRTFRPLCISSFASRCAPRFVQDESPGFHGEGIVGPETQHAGEGVLDLPVPSEEDQVEPAVEECLVEGRPELEGAIVGLERPRGWIVFILLDPDGQPVLAEEGSGPSPADSRGPQSSQN